MGYQIVTRAMTSCDLQRCCETVGLGRLS